MRRFALTISILALVGCGRPDALLRAITRVAAPERRAERRDPEPERCRCVCPASRTVAGTPTSRPASPTSLPASRPAVGPRLPRGARSPAAVEGLRRILGELERRRGGGR